MPPSSTPRPSLADRAYDLLLDRLVMLDIAPGEPINETTLTAELDMGRTPVREALKRLEAEHLVQTFPRRGTFAARADLADLRSITEMRMILEPAGARKAAADADDEQRARLRALASDIASLRTSAPDARALIEFDLATHRAVYRLVENAYMRESLFRLDNQATRLWWSVIQDVPSVADHIAGHQSLLTAVADGDPDTAAELAREHVTEFHAQLQGALLKSAAL